MVSTNQAIASHQIVSTLHKSSTLRSLAKRLLHGFTIKQSFHNGLICLDALEHSWAWTGKRRYQTFDLELQNKLLLLSKESELFIDIGSNIGAMTFSLLLRNPEIDAVCIDPNSRAVSLLQNSAKINNLEHRCQTIVAAVSDSDGVLNFDEAGSVTGHVSKEGKEVRSLSFSRLMNSYSNSNKCLVKIDIEGFETFLLENLEDIRNRYSLRLAIELHPLNFNGVGDPEKCLSLLRDSGATITGMNHQVLNEVEKDDFTQAFVTWPHK